MDESWTQQNKEAETYIGRGFSWVAKQSGLLGDRCFGSESVNSSEKQEGYC